MDEKTKPEAFEKAKAEKLTLEDEALKGVSGGDCIDGGCYHNSCPFHACDSDGVECLSVHCPSVQYEPISCPEDEPFPGPDCPPISCINDNVSCMRDYSVITY